MQTDATVGIGAGETVFQVSFYRTTHFCQLTTNLMMTTGFEMYFEQIVSIGMSNELIA